jgi:hypothetical protein
MQEKPKGRRRMDVAADYEAPNTFYKPEEGEEMVPWRGNRMMQQCGSVRWWSTPGAGWRQD